MNREEVENLVADCDADSLIRICRAAIDGLMVQRVMMQCDLAPVHKLLWEGLLAPLKLTSATKTNNPITKRKTETA